jgi:hypothetical protein
VRHTVSLSRKAGTVVKSRRRFAAELAEKATGIR